MKRLFFITGHGRSGTHYMAVLFFHFGYFVGAQCDEKHGQSHNFPALWPPERIRESYKHIIQVVREPKKVVESVFLAKYSIPDQTQRRIKEIASDNKLEHAIRSVVLWNERINRARPDLVVRVEEAPDVCERWLLELGLPVNKRGRLPAPTANRRRAGAWDLNKIVPWESVSDEARDMLDEHAKRYGYQHETQ